MQAYLCAVDICAVIFVCTNTVAAENAADRNHRNVGRMANATIGTGQKSYQGIEMGFSLVRDEFRRQWPTPEVAGI